MSSQAIARNNRNAGGDRINMNNEVLLVRTLGKLHDIEDIKNITVLTRYGEPIHVSDVADVRVGSMTRYGGVTSNGEGEVVTGLVLLRKGANSLRAVEGTKQALEKLKSILPAGVTIEPFYDRTSLITKAVWTVEKALGEAVVLVLLVLIVMLGDIRSALTVALILPLSVLFTFIMMKLFDVSANLMSLGGLAIAIGILVDAAVVVVENIHAQFSRAPHGVSRLHLGVSRGAGSVGAGDFRHPDHHRGVPAAVQPDRAGRQNVLAAGDYDYVRADRLAAAVIDGDPGTGQPVHENA